MPKNKIVIDPSQMEVGRRYKFELGSDWFVAVKRKDGVVEVFIEVIEE